MENLEIYNKVRKVPQEAKKQISAGRLKGFTDINPMWRIKIMTEVFGACGIGWYYKIVDKRIEVGAPKITKEYGTGKIVRTPLESEKCAFVDVEVFIKQNGEWSMPIPGTGGSSFVSNEKDSEYTSDECFKMALTDALGVAFKALGVGADIYFDKDRTKYDAEPKEDVIEKQSTLPSVESAIEKVKSSNTIVELTKVWNDNKHLQKDASFAKSISDKRKEMGA